MAVEATKEQVAQKELQKAPAVTPSTIVKSQPVAPINENLFRMQMQTLNLKTAVYGAMSEIGVGDMLMRESFGSIKGLVMTPFTGPEKYKKLIEATKKMDERHKEFSSDLFKANKYLTDFNNGKVDGKELPKLFENMMISYGNFNAEALNAKGMIDEYHIDKASERLGAAFDAAMTVASVAGVTAVARAGGALLVKEGLKGAGSKMASAATKEGLANMGKGALNVFQNKYVWIANVALASSTSGVKVLKELDMAKAAQEFQENPKEGIRTMENLFNGLETSAKGNKNEPQIKEFIAGGREQLEYMSAKLEEPGHRIDYGDVAKTFAVTLGTSVLIEAGFGIAKGVRIKGAAPAERPAAEIKEQPSAAAEAAAKPKTFAAKASTVAAGARIIKEKAVEAVSRKELLKKNVEKSMEDKNKVAENEESKEKEKKA
ncbi:MAG: hypothetical protein NTY68_05215 [Candidatus Micrarchaeota archaeon]|nr:hypothetical protein [Candidatus Micrarchaeota archaeon]